MLVGTDTGIFPVKYEPIDCEESYVEKIHRNINAMFGAVGHLFL